MISPAKKVGSLEVDEDMQFQRKEWTVEHWSWIGMAIIAIAALLGLFGQGILSKTTVENGPIQVEYGRFERLLAPIQLESAV